MSHLPVGGLALEGCMYIGSPDRLFDAPTIWAHSLPAARSIMSSEHT